MNNKLLLTLLSFFLSITYSYAQLVKIIDVTTPGTLVVSLGDDKTKVTDLTLTGTINDADFTTIKQMSLLKVLDMSEVEIVNGAIPASAFLGRTTMDKIILPHLLVRIETDAFKLSNLKIDFSGCVSLTSVMDRAFMETKMPLDFSKCSSLKTFGNNCFWSAQGHVSLPDNLENLSSLSFQNFRGSVDFPSRLKTIGTGAFLNSLFTKPVVLPASLESIGVDGFKLSSGNIDFSGCVSLTSVMDRAFMETKMPLDFSKCSSLKIFGNNCFWSAQGHVSLPDNLENLSSLSFQNFRGSVDLGISLKTIGNSAFTNSTIKNILLPDSVEKIENYAFQNCVTLEQIISFNPTPPSLGTNVFSGVNKATCKLIVPKGSIDLYKSALQWKDFLQVEAAPVPSVVDLVYTEDGGSTILAEYKGVRIGEYYWMNNNFTIPTDIPVTKSQIDLAHDTYGMFNKQSTSPDNRTYWDYLGEQLGISSPSESQIAEKLLPEFQKYYGTYYTMNRDRINKLSYVRRFGSIKERINGTLVGQDDISHYWDGVRSVIRSKYWDLPTAADILQLIAMCGHGTMPEVRQFLSFKQNEVPVALVAPGMDWFYPNSINFANATYPSDEFDSSNTNKYKMNIVPNGFRWGLFQSSLKVKNEQGFVTLYNVPADELVGAGLNQALALPIIDKDQDNLNTESRIFTSFQLGDHPVISYNQYPSADAIPMRWCRALSDEELGYKLYINQDMNSVNYPSSSMVIYAAMVGEQYASRKRSGEEILLEKVRSGAVNKEDISIIKLGLDDNVPEGYTELPRGYIRGFYVQYILDNPIPRKTVAELIDIALINPYLWIGSVSRLSETELRSAQIEGSGEIPVTIYPNPVTEVLYFDSVETISGVKLYSTSGKMVLNQANVGSSINVAHLASGTYILKFQARNKSYTQKIIKR